MLSLAGCKSFTIILSALNPYSETLTGAALHGMLPNTSHNKINEKTRGIQASKVQWRKRFDEEGLWKDEPQNDSILEDAVCSHYTPSRISRIFAKKMNVIIEGEDLTLLPERALWWPARQSLILSDVHWGKSGHFRKHGYAIPGGTQDADAARLSAIIHRHKPERLIIAGDLFHSRHNKEVDAFGRWRAAHSGLHIDFIIGNHDILSKAFYEAQALTIHAENLLLEPFFISHDAVQNPLHFTIHGHIHPGVRVSGIRAVSLPAFCFNKTCAVLPAFGGFTGCKAVRLGDYDRIFVIGDGKVLPLKGVAAN